MKKTLTLTDFLGDRIVLDGEEGEKAQTLRVEGVTKEFGIVLDEDDLEALRDYLDEILGDRVDVEERKATPEERAVLLQAAKDLARRALPDECVGFVVLDLGAES